MTIREEYRDRSPIYGPDDAARRNEQAGLHFFERPTLAFFSSRVGDQFYLCEARHCSYFVTSERAKSFTGNPSPRLYTVRAIDWHTGQVRRVGDFQGYRISTTAHRAAKRASLAQAEPVSDRDAGSHAVVA